MFKQWIVFLKGHHQSLKTTTKVCLNQYNDILLSHVAFIKCIIFLSFLSLNCLLFILILTFVFIHNFMSTLSHTYTLSSHLSLLTSHFPFLFDPSSPILFTPLFIPTNLYHTELIWIYFHKIEHNLFHAAPSLLIKSLGTEPSSLLLYHQPEIIDSEDIFKRNAAAELLVGFLSLLEIQVFVKLV